MEEKIILSSIPIMPNEGKYELRKISPTEFFNLVSKMFEENKLDNYIYFRNTLNMIKKYSKINIKPNYKRIKLNGNPVRGLVVTLKDDFAIANKKNIKKINIEPDNCIFYEFIYNP